MLMQIHRRLQDFQLPASACAIGLFDGVHIGHQRVLAHALREAQIRKVPSLVVSFADHPQRLTSQTPTPLLSDLEERLARFATMGFDYALIPPFDEKLMSISAQDFVDKILRQQLNVQSVTVGYDHRFGKNRLGDGSLLRQMGQEHGFSVHIIEPVRVSDERFRETTLNEPKGPIVSSTLIRKLVSYGELPLSNRLLGYEYFLSGTIVSGLQRGRLLGFPTANLSPNERRLIPANGTYGGSAQMANGKEYRAVCNIGLSPTFGDQAQKRVEVHLLEYSGPEFYGDPLLFRFERKLRDERKFDSKEALIAQIESDCQQSLLSIDSQQAFYPPQHWLSQTESA
jgi:riboflavin kinase / FMN adenylyltransferase